MICKESTLADICFAVAEALDAYAISGILTGGSAAAIYAPQSYISHDADFILEADNSLQDVAIALKTIGFVSEARREQELLFTLIPNLQLTFQRGR